MRGTLSGNRYEAGDTPAVVANVFAAFAKACIDGANYHRAQQQLSERSRAEEIWDGIPAYVRFSWAWWAGARAAAAADARRRKPLVEVVDRRRIMKVTYADAYFEQDGQAPLTERWDPERAAGLREWGMVPVRAWWITVELDGFSHFGDPAGVAQAAGRKSRLGVEGEAWAREDLAREAGRVQYGYAQPVDYTDAAANRASIDAIAVQRWREHARAAGYQVADPTSVELLRDRFPRGPFDGALRVEGPAVELGWA